MYHLVYCLSMHRLTNLWSKIWKHFVLDFQSCKILLVHGIVTISSINSTLGTTTSKKHGHACRDTLTCLSAPVETKFPVRLCKSKNLLSPKNCTCASIFVHQVHITSKNLHPSNMALHTSHCHISFE
jgi:hypothetical protein